MKKITTHIEEIQSILDSAGSISIITHKNPDGDAIGSVLGLYHYLKKKYTKIHVFSPNDYPAFLKWLPGTEDVFIFTDDKSLGSQLFKTSDVIFCLDFNQISRTRDIKNLLESSDAVKIMIDHHPHPENFADYMMSDIHASSTAELIYEFIHHFSCEKPRDQNIAECLYTGIMTDTGSFSHNSSNPRTWRIVSELLECCINKDEIYYKVYDNYSADRMRLMGYCLHEKMQVIQEYNTAFISISEEELKRFNYTIGDTEGFVNLPLSIKDIFFTGLFIEKKNHVKMSFRSKGRFAVNEFSRRYFEGGGHHNAAGGESKLGLKDTIEFFISLLPVHHKEIIGEK